MHDKVHRAVWRSCQCQVGSDRGWAGWRCNAQIRPVQMLELFMPREPWMERGSRFLPLYLCTEGSEPQSWARCHGPAALRLLACSRACIWPARNPARGIQIHLHPQPVTAQGAVGGYSSNNPFSRNNALGKACLIQKIWCSQEKK